MLQLYYVPILAVFGLSNGELYIPKEKRTCKRKRKRLITQAFSARLILAEEKQPYYTFLAVLGREKQEKSRFWRI